VPTSAPVRLGASATVMLGRDVVRRLLGRYAVKILPDGQRAPVLLRLLSQRAHKCKQRQPPNDGVGLRPETPNMRADSGDELPKRFNYTFPKFRNHLRRVRTAASA
jgi:hypothetical protein